MYAIHYLARIEMKFDLSEKKKMMMSAHIRAKLCVVTPYVLCSSYEPGRFLILLRFLVFWLPDPKLHSFSPPSPPMLRLSISDTKKILGVGLICEKLSLSAHPPLLLLLLFTKWRGERYSFQQTTLLDLTQVNPSSECAD